MVSAESDWRRSPVNLVTPASARQRRAGAGLQRPATSPTMCSESSATSLTGSQRGIGGGAVHLEDPRLGRVRRHRALEHQPDRVVVLEHTVGRDPLEVQRVHVEQPPHVDDRARSPRSPRAPPRRAGPRRARPPPGRVQAPGRVVVPDSWVSSTSGPAVPSRKHQRVRREPLAPHRLADSPGAAYGRALTADWRGGHPGSLRPGDARWTPPGAATPDGWPPLAVCVAAGAGQLRNDPKSKSSSATDWPVGWPKS